MKKNIFLITAFCLCALMLTGCGNNNNTASKSDNSSSQSEITKSEPEKETIPFEKTIGVWTYSDDIIFHSSDGNRYALIKNDSGTVQDKDGTSYSVQECGYKLVDIINLSDTTLNLKEGKFSEAYVGSQDYPDGYKTMMIAYQKSDLFDLDQLEEAVKNGVSPVTQQETTASETEEITTESQTEEVTTEAETTVPETTETQPSETSADTENETSGETENPETAEYAVIYKKLEDFLETDNYKQKDAGNRSLEVFNYLHNMADPNIEESSITNDTAKNEVSFKCYDKYIIIINNADAEITVKTE